MNPILEIHHLSKKYRIRHASEGYLSLRERMLSALRFEKSQSEDFWALDDVSFNVRHGESIGIIGRNGAGKSTLLKILSKITLPTQGKIVIRGRIASLLEVGTGFHPELTGRENIFFNGSLLGMKRKEIEGKFDAIVDFSGVEKFLDTALKHYSSGMQLRLAFSVAAFLDPEILVIDEVLAVGDAEFQKKCLGKMEDVTKSGRTILFVSHNLAAVKTLCTSCVLLDRGKAVQVGDTSSVIGAYMSTHRAEDSRPYVLDRAMNDSVTLREFWISTREPAVFSELQLRFRLVSTSLNPISGLSLLFYNAFQERVAIIDLRSEALVVASKAGPEIEVSVELNDLALIEGDYQIGLYVESNLCTGNFLDIMSLTVHNAPDLKVMPYPVQVRGMLELKNSFVIK
jgi:lipopolysaccharide transport system ATP-binding protein